MARLTISDMPARVANCGAVASFAAAALIAGMVMALAQTPQPQFAPAGSPPALEAQPPAPAPSLPASPPPEAAPAPKQDGFFDAMKSWMDKSAKDFKASVDESNAKWREFGKKTEKAANDAAAAQKEAADAFMNLSNVRIVEGNRTCETAANGSPDCQSAAEVICRRKGFAKGQSADIQTTRKCSARAWLERNEGDCRIETVVVKAACQ